MSHELNNQFHLKGYGGIRIFREILNGEKERCCTPVLFESMLTFASYVPVLVKVKV